MKITTRIATVFILATMATTGGAQTITVCTGSSATLTAVNSASLNSPSYSMNPGGIASPNPNFVVSPASSTTYTLYTTGTDSNSAVVTTSTTVTVQVAPLPVTSISPVTQTVGCGPGVVGTATSTAISPANNVTHIWYAPGVPQLSDGNPVSIYSMSVMGPSTTYTCKVVDNITGCSSTKTTQVISIGGTYPTFGLSSSQTFSIGCTTRSVTTVNIVNPQSGSGGVVSFTLLAPGFTGPGYGTGPVSTYTVNSPGTYIVIVKDNVNNCETRLPVSIIQNTVAPNISSSALTRTLSCAVPSVILNGISVNSPTTMIDFTWSFQNGPNPNVINNYSLAVYTQAPFTNSVINTYTLNITDQNNACKNSTIVTMWQNTRPPNAVIAGATGVCQTSVNLSNFSTSGILPNTFPISQPLQALLWEGPPPQPTLGFSSSYLAQTVGIYTMTVMDLNNGCIKTTTCSVTNLMLKPTAAFVHTITGGQAVFNNMAIGTDSNTAYFWDFGDGGTSMQQNPIHTYLNTGSFLVKFKVLNSGACTDSIIQSVTISSTSGLAPVETNGQASWSIAPNPNSGAFNLSLQATESKALRVLISDLTGRRVHEQFIEPGISSTAVYPGKLPSGMYLVTLESNGLKATKRMIIQQ